MKSLTLSLMAASMLFHSHMVFADIQSSPLLGQWESTEDRPYGTAKIPCRVEKKGAKLKLTLVQANETNEFYQAGDFLVEAERSSPDVEGVWVNAFDRGHFGPFTHKMHPIFIYLGEGESLRIQHGGHLSEDGFEITQTIGSTHYKAFILPVDQDATTEKLTVNPSDSNQLTYRLWLGGELANECLFRRLKD